MSLKALTAEAEQIILALTPEQRAAAARGIDKLLSAIEDFQPLPDRLFKVIGLGGVELVLKVSAGWKLESLAGQIVRASPRLLEPNRVKVETLLSAVQRER